MERFIGIGLLWFIPTLVLGQDTQRAVPLSASGAPYGYYEYLPEGYDQHQEYPMILFLHGLGEIGDGETELEKLEAHGPPRMISEGSEFPAVVLSPQSTGWWDIHKIGDFVKWAFANYAIDTTRLYVTGISMGGGGAWLYGVMFPDYPAAIIPICGAADTTQTDNLHDVPVWAFHNIGDPVVSVSLTYQWLAGIRAAGGEPKSTIYPSDLHDAWTQTYQDSTVWQWLFAQSQNRGELLAVQGSERPMVYPNPFRDVIHIRMEKRHKFVKAYDVEGKEIDKITLIPTEQGVDVQMNVPPGIYYLAIENAGRLLRHRVWKR